MHSLPRLSPTMASTHARVSCDTAARPTSTGRRASASIDVHHRTQSESLNELQALRQRGLYHGPGEARAQHSQVAAAQEYVKSSAPVVEERVRKRAVHEIVPTVRREREVAEVRHAVLPIHQHVRQGRTYSERQLEEIQEPEYRVGRSEVEVGKNRAIAERLSQGYREELPTEHEYLYRKPQVEEIVRRRVIHVIHPVLQRHVDRIHHERTYVSIHERVFESPRVIETVDVLAGMSEEEWIVLRQHAVRVAKSIGMRDEFYPTSTPIPTTPDEKYQYQQYLKHRQPLPAPPAPAQARPAHRALPAPVALDSRRSLELDRSPQRIAGPLHRRSTLTQGKTATANDPRAW